MMEVRKKSERGAEVVPQLVQSIREDLSEAFIWVDALEGHEYWKTVDFALKRLQEKGQ